MAVVKSDPKAEGTPQAFDVLVVGAGVGGLYALYRLRQLGYRVRVIEAADNVGGTWYWNRYPGCRCDVESMEYSYSFSDELQQEWHWPERYGTQPEILKYINHVADHFDLRRDIQFNTRIRAARFDEAANRWIVTTDRGEAVTARFCVMATGNLSTPRVPAFKGIERFKGRTYHTGLWPKEGVDFTAQRLAVIGTGSSGVQMIPIVAKQAKHLFVFQRTANFSLPAMHAPLDPAKERQHKATYAERRRAAYDTPFGIAGYPPPTKQALQATPEEREADYQRKWNEGGSISFLYSYTDLLTNKEANDTASEFVRGKIRATVRDPKVAEALCPKDHPIGTKRLILDSDYYETYNRDNVTLVDIRNNPIETITEKGIRLANGEEYEVDAIAFATGFDAMTGALKDIDIEGRGGRNLRQHWQDGPRTYLGLMIAGFPNLFTVTGPQSPGVKSQMILACEHHVDFIAACLQWLDRRGLARIDASDEAEAKWVAHNLQVADSTLYPLANSWYMGANIPGKPRVFMPYVGGVQNYRKKLDEVVAKDYEGFVVGGKVRQAAAAE
ncbi:MAG: NAD(P)/FAD-dependent oxidoreductase [Alphaproteobacteria bacterium]|nr:NAD(P)/FAD-dependent oxidoreductase [Alphaproteobacteria bacterium]